MDMSEIRYYKNQISKLSQHLNIQKKFICKVSRKINNLENKL